MMLTGPERKPAAGENQPHDWARKILRYTPIAILITALYAVFVLWARRSDNRAVEVRAQVQAAAERRAEDQRSLDNMGGTQFDILGFYATPGLIHHGDSAELCYGVANAQSVKIEPETSRAMWPSVSRCIEITPKKTTTYTLTADDGHGDIKTATLTIEVR
jgi:type II secretory pathway pseudopilin PulG